MRSKFRWLLIAILLGVLVYFYDHKETTVFDSGNSGNNNLNMSEDNSGVIKTINTTKAQTVQPLSQSRNSPDDLINNVLAQFKERVYSDDDLVELGSIGLMIEKCRSKFFSWKLNGKKMTALQSQAALANNQRCEYLEGKYSSLSGAENIGKKQFLMMFQPNSALGYVLQAIAQEGKPTEENLHDLLALSVKEKNDSMLLLYEEFSSLMNLSISGVTDALNKEYNDYSNEIALYLMACDFQDGITCQESGQFMMERCFENDQYCGMNLKQWYELFITPAHKADIELLINYYRNFEYKVN